MRTQFLLRVLFVAAFAFTCNQSYGQSFLKKVANAAKKSVTSVASSVLGNEDPSSSSDAKEEVKDSINWEKIPVYSVQLVKVTDDNGNVLKNEDGTEVMRVYLVDQDGNKRSKEAVEAQHAKLRKLTNKIVGNVVGDAAIGAAGALLSGKGLKGAAVGAAGGAAVGALFSSKDIAEAKKLKKNLKEQEKLLAEYSKSFTSEGEVVDASVDLSSLSFIDLNADNVASMTSSEIKSLTEDPAFQNADDSSWDLSGLL